MSIVQAPRKNIPLRIFVELVQIALELRPRMREPFLLHFELASLIRAADVADHVQRAPKDDRIVPPQIHRRLFLQSIHGNELLEAPRRMLLLVEAAHLQTVSVDRRGGKSGRMMTWVIFRNWDIEGNEDTIDPGTTYLLRINSLLTCHLKKKE